MSSNLKNTYHKRCKILYVTCHNPIGQDYGARLRSYNIANILKQMADISLVLMVSEPQDEKCINQARKEFDLKAIINLVHFPWKIATRIKKEIDPRFCGIRDQAVGLLDKEFFLKEEKKYDLVWFHTVRIPDALGKYAWKRSILDVDDMQSQLYKTHSLKEIFIFRRLLDFRMRLIWRRRENLYLNRFDILCVCSEKDKESFGNSTRVHVVRNGFQHRLNVEIKGPDCDFPMLGFIGRLDYLPNYNGIEWFIKEVWPIIKNRIPKVKLRLIGKGTDCQICSHGDDIEGLGYIQDTDSEIGKWTGMVIPIKQGGGTRIKIAEGFARRIPVIATKLGAYGYEIENGKEAIIADKPEDFANGCIKLINNPLFGKTMAENAFKKYLKLYTWEAQKNNVFIAVENCLSRNLKN